MARGRAKGVAAAANAELDIGRLERTGSLQHAWRQHIQRWAPARAVAFSVASCVTGETVPTPPRDTGWPRLARLPMPPVATLLADATLPGGCVRAAAARAPHRGVCCYGAAELASARADDASRRREPCPRVAGYANPAQARGHGLGKLPGQAAICPRAEEVRPSATRGGRRTVKQREATQASATTSTAWREKTQVDEAEDYDSVPIRVRAVEVRRCFHLTEEVHGAIGGAAAKRKQLSFMTTWASTLFATLLQTWVRPSAALARVNK
eukprot:CAMPEP_0176291016 /NCGR_PEP_ID=MMETSP0121_2-20121125/55325_1 /TAXON_ID=160619 /ORGANISM="Kryptoperidinium foliaceum, Strain CCMP 1326" /LENGTH=266 /DNA_ID=CAMNT_0017631833 /DNA_START=35 /DNA_END=842 /DNA_ORIENTATION=+